MKRTLPFKKEEFKALISLAIPILITQLFLVGMGATDVAITGHFDTAVQASVGLGVMIWNPLFLFGNGVLMSIAILSAHKFGAGKTDEVATIWHNGLIIAAGLIVLVVLIMNFGVEWILNLVDADPKLIPGSVLYLRALSIGAPAILLFISLRSVCEGVSKPLPITIVSGVGFVVNGLLNYVLVNGYAPLNIKSYGVWGSGLGTALTLWIMFLLLLTFTRVDPRLKSLNLMSTKFRFTNIFGELAKIGFPNGATMFAEVAIFSAAGLILGRYAEKIVASHQISLQITSLTFMIPLSTAIALTALVGQRMGRGDFPAAKQMGDTGRITIVGIMFLTSSLLFYARNHLPMLFNNEAAVVALSAKLILYSIIFQIPDGLQISANGVLRGMKDTKVPMVLSVTSYWLVAFPLCYYLGVTREMAAEGVWIGLIIGLSCSALLLNSRLFILTRRLGAQ